MHNSVDEQIREREQGGLELSVWGLKKAALSKRGELVDLKLQVRQAEDALRKFNRKHDRG